MSYLINRYNGQELVAIEDAAIDTTTSLTFVGRNYTGYGEIQNENFLWLLENFANSVAPNRPVSGQLWYKTADNTLNVYNGTDWTILGSATTQDTAPENPTVGMFWLKTPYNSLYVWAGLGWVLVGPETAEGFAETKASSTTVLATDGSRYPIIKMMVSGVPMGIVSANLFTIDSTETIPGFNNIKMGYNSSSLGTFIGNLDGLAARATILDTARNINGVGFNGASDITIKSSTTRPLTAGDHIIGSTFDGSTDTTWNIDATSSNIIGKIVSRDSAGNFSAGTITANLTGNVTGNVTATGGTSTFNTIVANEVIGPVISGNSSTTTRLLTARKINGVNFDGTKDINVPVPAVDITGDTLPPNLKYSILNRVGTLESLKVADAGVTIGSGNQLQLLVDGTTPYISNAGEAPLELGVVDFTRTSAANKAKIRIIPASVNLAESGVNYPALAPKENFAFDLGQDTSKFRTVYADVFDGTATAARYADLAEFYSADKEYEAGTVLIFGGSAEVTITNQKSDNRVAGVVSANPAHAMNVDLEGIRACIALQGRVPCKVVGKVKKGEMLMTSSISGHATRVENPEIGTIIGKSLEDKTDDAPGIIEVAVGRV